MERPPPFDSQCGRCALPMEMVVAIEPFAGQPGLHAYVCSKCGSTRSRLIPPNMRQPTKGPCRRGAKKAPELRYAEGLSVPSESSDRARGAP
jgi:hypothetical protein